MALASVTASLVCAAACTAIAPPSYTVAPVRSNGQDLQNLDDRTTLESRDPTGIVAVRADDQFADFGVGFAIVVHNLGGEPTEFGPTQVEARLNGRPVEILAAAELSVKATGVVKGYVRATSGRRRTIEEATEDFNREYRFNNYGGCPAGQSCCQVYSADNGSRYRQDRISREREAQTVARAALDLVGWQTLIAQRALRPSRVGPNAITGGVLVVEPPPVAGEIELRINFNGKSHVFAFRVSPAD